MSSIEEQLVRDIAAVTRGVMVSETDLRDAQNAINTRSDARRRRDRRLTLGAAAAVVAIVGVVGYGAFQSLSDDEASAPPVTTPSATADPDASFLTGAAPTTELINGVWRVDDGGLLIRFSAPDKVFFDDGGELYSDPNVQGTYAIDGDLITVTATGGRDGCAGQTFSMRASLPSSGAMKLVHAEAGTGDCVATQGERWALEQVLPTSAGLAALSTGESDWTPVEDASTVTAVWMAQGGGYALELAQDGSYYVADEFGEPVDRGQWSLLNSRMTLTSSAASTECAEGDQLVLNDLQHEAGTATTIRWTVGQNTCGGSWAAKSWIRLPDNSSG